MDFLTDWLTDWLKELLIGGIMGNLEGLFDYVNTQVGEIAVQVGTTPAAWNAGVFSLIRQLSETVILPIAGLVLTFVATYELIQMLLEKNNMHEFDVANIYKWMFKTACAIFILSNTFDIVMAVFDVSQTVIAQAGGLIQGSTDITPDMMAELETTLEGMDLGPLLGLWLQSSIIGVTMWALGIVIFVLVYGRMLEIYLLTSLAPIPMATISHREVGQMGQNYLRSLFAVGFQGLLILVCVAIYAVLIQGIATGGDPIGAIWGTVGYTVLLCFMLFKTGTIARSIFSAHYCLIPSNKGQRMMVIKGSGGEGKSQIGAVLAALFGSNMKDGSIGKISENRFARADLEHILLCVDDDMRMEALRQTNYVKSIVTAQGKMDLERKGKQSYQGWMCARLLAFSNGDLQALFDRSDGFYRRQLVLTTKEKPADRMDDPDLAEKMKMEIEGIFFWAFAGLQRLVANNFKFTESQRTRENRESVKRDNNNVFDFLESEGYIRLKADASISSKELYEAYQIYCAENNLTTMKPRSFSDAVIGSQSRYNLEYCNNVTNAAGRRVRGFFGIEALVHPNISVFSGDSLRTYVPKDAPEGWRD